MDCNKCGSNMKFRTGRFGNFWGCSNFPRCKNKITVKGSGRIFVKQEVNQPVNVPLIPGSDQQESVWDFMINGTDHAVVHACPGTGKTFSLVQGTARLDRSNQSIIYLAFNNTIRDEMLTKAPLGVMVRGLNQFGHGIVTKAFSKVKLDENKYYKLYNQNFPANTPEEIKVQVAGCFKAKELVNLCQSYHLDPSDSERVQEIMTTHDVRLPEVLKGKILDALPTLLELGKKPNADGTMVITFGDQLWLPVVLDLPTPQFDMVCIDEAQDLNSIQHHLVIRTLHSKSRMIVVGDENQAIYGFRGADTDSMATLTEMLNATGKNVHHFPLTKTFRCGKKIVELAQQYVPQIEAHENNPDGDVQEDGLETCLSTVDGGDMVICRMNAPLIKLAYKLMKLGKKVRFVGKPFGEAIVGLVEALQASSLKDLHFKLAEYETRERQKIDEKAKEGQNVAVRSADLDDRLDCIRVFLRTLELQSFVKCDSLSIPEIVEKMRDFFCCEKVDPDTITLSSIHRAKGTERDRVFYFMPGISFKNLTEKEEKQELNLKFVAITRAKHLLSMVHCTLEELSNSTKEDEEAEEDLEV